MSAPQHTPLYPFNALIQFYAKLMDISVADVHQLMAEQGTLTTDVIRAFLTKRPKRLTASEKIAVMELYKLLVPLGYFKDEKWMDFITMQGITEEKFLADIRALVDELLGVQNTSFPSNFNDIVKDSAQYQLFYNDYQHQILSLLMTHTKSVVIHSSLSNMGKTQVAQQLTNWISEHNDELEIPFEKGFWFDAELSQFNRPKQLKTFVHQFNQLFHSAFEKDDLQREIANHRYLIIINGFASNRIDSSLISFVEELVNTSQAIKSKFILVSDDIEVTRHYPSRIVVKGYSEYEISKLLAEKGYTEKQVLAAQLKKRLDGNIRLVTQFVNFYNEKGSTSDKEMINTLLKRNETFLIKCFNNKVDDIRDNRIAISIINELRYFPGGCNQATLAAVLEMDTTVLASELNKLAAVDLVQADQDHYSVGSLLIEYLKSQQLLNSFDYVKDLKRRARYYISLTKEISYCWSEPERLVLLDVIWLRQALEDCIKELQRKALRRELCKLTFQVRYYYYVRGIRNKDFNMWRADAARQLKWYPVEYDALMYHTNILIKRDERLEEVNLRMKAIEELRNDHPELKEKLVVDYQHLLALYHAFINDNEIAIRLWNDNLENPGMLEHQKNTNGRYLAETYVKTKQFDSARLEFAKLRDQAKAIRFVRGELSAAAAWLEIESNDFQSYTKERLLEEINRYLSIAASPQVKDAASEAKFYELKGRLLFKMGDPAAALECLQLAANRYLHISLKKYSIINEFIDEITND